MKKGISVVCFALVLLSLSFQVCFAKSSNTKDVMNISVVKMSTEDLVDSSDLTNTNVENLIKSSTYMVSWKSIVGTSYYEVRYKDKTEHGSWVRAGTTTSTSYTLYGLTKGHKYKVSVRAYDNSYHVLWEQKGSFTAY